MLKNTKIKQSGFTLVELLIVIVVIAILAAITIVAYNGIQNRAKTSAGQTLANSIQKKAQAYNTIQSVYPTWSELKNNYDAGTTVASTTTSEAKLDDATSLTASATTALTSSNANGGKTVQYGACAATGAVGARIVYWDYTKTSGQATTINLGDTTTCTTFN